ncbi:MAG: N-acetylneuraminate synthase [Nitrospira sp.]|nr:N-acetylneuraminate synthase [Nitrospira sp.]
MYRPADRVFIIAEAGMNHDGSLGIACRMVDVAAECGVDGVKFQTHIAEAETLRDAPAPPYFTAEPRYEYFQRTAFSQSQWESLKAHCETRKTRFLSSPFSCEAVDLLEKVGVTIYKIPSGEVTNLSLVEAVATTGKPILLSSGMSNWTELDRAVNAILKRHDRVTVLQCTSEYPCPYERVGLNVMCEMRDRYRLAVGLSDHTLTNYAAFAAAAVGASVIEKHFTLSKNLYGSDAKHSVEPAELCDLVRGIRAIEVLLSTKVDKDDAGPFHAMKHIFEKSIVVLMDIPEGARIERSMVGIKKPGTGIPAWRIEEIVGRRVLRRVPSNSLLRPEDIDWERAADA